MPRIRAARHYQDQNSPVCQIARRGRVGLKRDLRGALPHLRELFDRHRAEFLLRHGRVREIAGDAIDWGHFREAAKAVFERWAQIYEEGARLGARKINGSFHSRRRRVRFRKTGNIIELTKQPGHDVSDEPRDEHGRWTTGGGGSDEGGGGGIGGGRSSDYETVSVGSQKVYRVGPDGMTGRQAFSSQGGRGVYAFSRLEDAREFQSASGGRIYYATLAAHTQGRVDDVTVELLHGASFSSGDAKVFGNNGSSELYDAGTQLYVRDSSLFSAYGKLVVAPVGKAIGDRYNFDRFNEGTQQRLKNAQDEFIKELEAQARLTINKVVMSGQLQGLGPDAIVEDIWSVIDLTATQAQAVLNYENMLRTQDPAALVRQLRDDAFDSAVQRSIDTGDPLSESAIGEMVDAYEENYVEYRAKTIAQTESVRAANWGLRDAYSQAVERGALPDDAVKRYWQLGDHPCPVCESIPDQNEDGVGVDEAFDSIDGPQDDPPVHPNCECSVEYVTDITKVPEEGDEEE